MRTRSFRLLLAKVFRAFRDIKAVFQARFGAHGAGPIPRRIKGLRIFARSTRAHPRVRERSTYAVPQILGMFVIKGSTTPLGERRRRPAER